MKKHNSSIDYLRIMSAIAIILIHIVSSDLSKGSAVYDIETVNLLQIVHSLLNWSVPMFFLITGYLFLNSEKEYTYKQMIKPITKIFTAIVVVGAMYSVMERLYTEKTVSVKLLVGVAKDIISGNLWDHMWYLYAILGIYLVIPVIKPFFDKSSVKDMGIFIYMCYIANIILPVLSEVSNIEIAFYIPISGYITYVLVGGFIGKVIDYILSNKIIVRYIALSVFVATFIYVIISKNQVEYLSISASFMAIALFLNMITYDNLKSGKVCKSVAVATYGIYLIHPLFVNVQMNILYLSPLKKWPIVLIPINVLSIFVISYVIVFLIQKLFEKKAIFLKQAK